MAEKSRVYQRYQWLIDLIQRSGGISLEEINKAWQRSSMNPVSYAPLSERTFHRHKNEIEEIFGIKIICRNKRYYIGNEEEVEAGGVQDWMLSTIAVDNMLAESKDLRDRIQFEEIPGGINHLDTIIKAMRENTVLHMVYQSFWSDSEQDTWIHPYFLKVFQQRWYVVGKPGTHPDTVRTYALDRVVLLEPMKEKFKYPKKFDPSEYYRDSYGIFHGETPAEQVILKVDDDQVKYFDSLKPHYSQTKRDDLKIPGFTFYEYKMSPAYDFVQFLLSKGSLVKVMQPESLRLWVAKEVRGMYENYKADFKKLDRE